MRKQLDKYHLEIYQTTVIHMGAVNVLKWLSGERKYSVIQIMYQFVDLHAEIREINKMATIIFSGIIPMPGKARYGADTIIKKINSRLETFAAGKSNTIFVNSASLFVQNNVVNEKLYADWESEKVHLNEEGVHVLNNWYGQVIGPVHIKEKLNASRRDKLSRKKWWN